MINRKPLKRTLDRHLSDVECSHTPKEGLIEFNKC